MAHNQKKRGSSSVKGISSGSKRARNVSVNIDKIFACTSIGIRQSNDDRYSMLKYGDGFIISVFDGNGEGVKDMVDYCKNHIVGLLDETDKNDRWDVRLGNSLIMLDSGLMINANFSTEQGASAAVAYYDVGQNVLYCANIGNSIIEIIDNKTGDTMEAIDDAHIVHHDMMDFSGVGTMDKSMDFITCTHQYTEKTVRKSKEFAYYETNNLYSRVVSPIGTCLLNMDVEGKNYKLITTRSLGNFHWSDIIRKPQTYVFRLTSEQKTRATILAYTKGIYANKVIPHGSLGKLLVKPLTAINMLSYFSVMELFEEYVGLSHVASIHEINNKFVQLLAGLPTIIKENLQKVPVYSMLFNTYFLYYVKYQRAKENMISEECLSQLRKTYYKLLCMLQLLQTNDVNILSNQELITKIAVRYSITAGCADNTTLITVNLRDI